MFAQNPFLNLKTRMLSTIILGKTKHKLVNPSINYLYKHLPVLWKRYDVREMITDGCRADNPFASRNIQIKGSRTEWNNDEVLTLSNDQFQVDLWNPVGNTADNVIIYSLG